uniref:Uncharacterized protein n=1 Tax=Medicago truncatula TaxID=3880 RepID=Q2HRK8_MEDTR|nr:hypothetical protein MtrDRAFT_AC158501g2v2 [Medicago truncatula]
MEKVSRLKKCLKKLFLTGIKFRANNIIKLKLIFLKDKYREGAREALRVSPHRSVLGSIPTVKIISSGFQDSRRKTEM